MSVLGRKYKIVDADLTADAAYGTSDEVKGVLSIDPVACASTYTEQDTVLHEVMHAVFRQQGRRYTKAEETFVTAMATGLLTVLQNNPALVRYLAKKP